MLNEGEIRAALHASRVVPVPVANPHGPLGLEHLAIAVERIMAAEQKSGEEAIRPIALPIEAWRQLDGIAQELGAKQSRCVTPDDVVRAFVLQGIDSVRASE